MTSRDWWLGLGLLVAAILCHAFVPRYEWRQVANSVTLIRIDRWTGRAELGSWALRQWTAEPSQAEIERTLKQWEAADVGSK